MKKNAMPLLMVLLLVASGISTDAAAGDLRRFSHSGDGRIHLVSAKNGAVFSGTYRHGPQNYDPAALTEIRRVFAAPPDVPLAEISLRLIEFIDFLQDYFKPDARISIASGWRSPEYNTKLRESGSLAATASLHQYGMAADIKIAGVSSRRVWDYVRQIGFGGAGFYNGTLVHVDVGPARSWDQTSSGVGTDISTENKLIRLVTDFDVYRPGEAIVLRFTRMTAFPIGVGPEFVLEKETPSNPAQTNSFRPVFAMDTATACPRFSDIAQMMNIRWQLPPDLPSGSYVIHARSCNNPWEAMPATISTAAFEVR
jgi:uncharacterized protein YcbK (DUF882 family)